MSLTISLVWFVLTALWTLGAIGLFLVAAQRDPTAPSNSATGPAPAPPSEVPSYRFQL
jgi:hypothetical protein